MAITGLGDGHTVLVEGKPGYIYVRVPQRVSTGTLEEYSEHIVFSQDEHRYNAPVMVARSKDNPSRWEVVGPWEIGSGYTVQAILNSVGPHHWSHELYNLAGGNDPVMLDTMQLRNLQVTPTNPPSSKVNIGSGWYIWKDRAVHWYEGDVFDLAAYVPSGTADSYVSLWLDPTDQSIVATAVDVTYTPFPSTIDELVAWPNEDYIPLACIRLSQLNYVISWSSSSTASFIDMRVHQAMMPGDYLPAGHPLDPSGGYHTGTLDSSNVSHDDAEGFYSSGTLDGILSELGMVKKKVAVSADDTFPYYLENKVVAGNGIDLSVLNPGGAEQLQVAGSGLSQTIDILDGDGVTTHHLAFTAGVLTGYTTS